MHHSFIKIDHGCVPYIYLLWPPYAIGQAIIFLPPVISIFYLLFFLA